MSQQIENTSDIVISVKDLETGFGDVTIHKDLDLDVRRGEIIGIVGGSGSGKTVLLKAIIGLLPVRSGTVKINDRDQAKMSVEEEQLARSLPGVHRAFVSAMANSVGPSRPLWVLNFGPP